MKLCILLCLTYLRKGEKQICFYFLTSKIKKKLKKYYLKISFLYLKEGKIDLLKL